MRKREDEEPEERPERPSRSQRRREVVGITKLGKRLTELRPDRLSRLELDEDLLDAIRTCTPLRHTARNRQVKLIGKMLRARDHEAILQAVEALSDAPS